MDSMSYPQASSLEVPLPFVDVLLVLSAKRRRLAGQSLTLAIAHVQMLEHQFIGANTVLRIFTDCASVSQCLGCLRTRLSESYKGSLSGYTPRVLVFALCNTQYLPEGVP